MKLVVEINDHGVKAPPKELGDPAERVVYKERLRCRREPQDLVRLLAFEARQTGQSRLSGRPIDEYEATRQVHDGI